MKIAYLVLCHKNSNQVDRLIRQLDNECVDFYIHVDAKANSFKVNNKANVIVLDEKERVDVRWASFSMISATLNLIKKCLKSSKEYDYVVLISGQDFPLKNNRQFIKFLEDNYGSNFIEILPKKNGLRKRYKKRNELYYPKWMFSRSLPVRILKKIYIYLTGGYTKTFGFFKRKSIIEKEFEFGSQWWCLRVDCLKWMMGYINTHPQYIAFFENSLTPDECFFQTLFSLSPFDNTRKDKITFFEWDRNRNNPRLITVSDVVRLVRSPKYFFARKFDMETDPLPIEKIESLLNKCPK